MDFSHSVKSLTNFIERNSVLQAPLEQWALLSKNHTQSTGFGGFVGRNWQWDDLVVRLRAQLHFHERLAEFVGQLDEAAIVNPAGENPPPGYTVTYDTTLSGSAALKIRDVLTFRSSRRLGGRQLHCPMCSAVWLSGAPRCRGRRR